MKTHHFPAPPPLTVSNLLKSCADSAQGGHVLGRIDNFSGGTGRLFLERLIHFNDLVPEGERILLPRWYREYLVLIGEMRIHKVYTTGVAQQGKTLGHVLLALWLQTCAGCNILWSYDQANSCRSQVERNFRPISKRWMNAFGWAGMVSVDNYGMLKVGDKVVYFTYVKTSSTTSKEGTAVAGSRVVGVGMDVAFKDERSQYPPGTSEVLDRRLDASRIASRPIRELGTPGSGAGIEAEISSCKYDFWPHCVCQNCGAIAKLHPFGSLLKPLPIKKGREASGVPYLSELGRPVDWHHKDSLNKAGSAYFGCPKCGEELTSAARAQSFFRCIKTDIDLVDFLSDPSLGDGQSLEVAVSLSALLRDRPGEAAAIIKEGLNTKNPADWCQQRLGVPSLLSSGTIALDVLRRSIGRPVPAPDRKTFRIAGFDQGRDQHWGVIVDFHLPAGWERMPYASLSEQCFRVVSEAGAYSTRDLVQRGLDVDFGLIDNEPDRMQAHHICRKTSLDMVNQQGARFHDARRIKVTQGGEQLPCWDISNDHYAMYLIGLFNSDLYSLPSRWEQFLYDTSEFSPIHHLQGVGLDPATGKIKRRVPFHLFVCLMFAEAALCIKTQYLGSDWGTSNYSTSR